MRTTLLLVALLMSGNALAQDTPVGQPPADAEPAASNANLDLAPVVEEPVVEEQPAVVEPQPVAPLEVREETPVSSTSQGARDVSFTIAPHVGVLVPQLFSELGSWPIFGLELGYILPFDVGSMQRPLQIAFDAMYSQPGSDGTANEPTLGENGQDFDWELTQRMVILELAALWRFMPPAQGLSVYGTLGPRLYLLETLVTASSQGSDFGENRETQMHFGFVVGGGVEYPVGPGSIFGALEFGWSDLNTTITGDSNTGTLVVDLGYRLMF